MDVGARGECFDVTFPNVEYVLLPVRVGAYADRTTEMIENDSSIEAVAALQASKLSPRSANCAKPVETSVEIHPGAGSVR